MNVILATQLECQDVLASLSYIIEHYGFAYIGDLKNEMGQSSVYADHKTGWTDLSGANISQVEHGWQLTLPEPVREADVLADKVVDMVMQKLRSEGIVAD